MVFAKRQPLVAMVYSNSVSHFNLESSTVTGDLLLLATLEIKKCRAWYGFMLVN